jgi:phospholipid-translocating ATPase
MRSSLLANFIIHRGFIISVIQIIFSCIFYYVSIPVFNSYLQLGYATIFTFWPVFALILDKDVNVSFELYSSKLRKTIPAYMNLFNQQIICLFLVFSFGCGRHLTKRA